MKLYNYHFNKAIWVYLDESDFYFRLGRFWRTPFADRFNYLNQFSNFDFLTFEDKLPTENRKLSYRELCLKRARELMNEYPDGIAVSVSGGVDSAGIVCSFLHEGIEPSKLRIICNEVIESEFPHFLDFLIAKGCKIQYLKDMNSYLSIYDNLPEKIILFGWCNDQLFHHVSCYKNPKNSLEGWTIGLYNLYKQYGIDIDRYYEADLDKIYNYSKLLNWDIERYYDVCTMLNFGIHYDVTRHYFQESTLNADTRKKVKQFFDTQEFQDWGFTFRHENKDAFVECINGNNQFYKRELKEIIYDVTKDGNYLKNKGKEPSWGKTQKSHKTELPFIVGVRDLTGYHVSVLDPYYINHNDMHYCNSISDLLLRDYKK